MSGSGPIYEYQRELTAKLEQVMRERDEAIKRLGITVERWGATERERDEARAEVERLRKALEKVMLCSHPPTGKACNCYRQGEAALRKSAPLVTEEEP